MGFVLNGDFEWEILMGITNGDFEWGFEWRF